MFLLKEHCITPSANLQAISSRGSCKHIQWVFSALSKDLLKIRYDQNPDLFNFLSLSSPVHVLSAASLFSQFLFEEYKKHILPVYLSLSHLAKIVFLLPRLETLADVLTSSGHQYTINNTEETLSK